MPPRRAFQDNLLGSSRVLKAGGAGITLLLLLAEGVSGCGPTSARHVPGSSTPPEPSITALGPEFSADVHVNQHELGRSVAPTAFGMHASVYDNALHDPAAPALVRAAGVSLLRWPGGGYSDNYHWATHTLTAFHGGSPGYLAEGSDFGSFVQVLESFGAQAMITVNYGSNQSGDGPGEPLEAAAWVAYANGDPSSAQVLGVDGTGFDWQTVGYWAGVRASAPLAVDDGYNRLRIAHAAPLAIAYWEIGNELFGNGYYASEYELDMHASYDAPRRGLAALSPSTYGRGVVGYAKQMKAVDPSIRVGAVLNTPPMDYSWGPDWNLKVLEEAGNDADFVIVHWYPTGTLRDILDAPRKQVPSIVQEIEKTMETCCPARVSAPEIAVTEMGPNSSVGIDSAHAQVTGLFAANGYASLFEHGIVNVDWLELHNGSFLSERNQRLGPAYKGIQLASHLVQSGDTFVTSTSSVPYALQAHAAARSDGSTSLMLVNLASGSVASVNLTFEDGWLPARVERYDYRPSGAAADGQVVGPVDLDPSAVSQLQVDAYSALVLVLHGAG